MWRYCSVSRQLAPPVALAWERRSGLRVTPSGDGDSVFHLVIETGELLVVVDLCVAGKVFTFTIFERYAI